MYKRQDNNNKKYIIQNIENKISQKKIGEGLNIVEEIGEGYKLGLIRKAGCFDLLVTVSPNGKDIQTLPISVDSNAIAQKAKDRWQCYHTPGGRWVCWPY